MGIDLDNDQQALDLSPEHQVHNNPPTIEREGPAWRAGKYLPIDHEGKNTYHDYYIHLCATTIQVQRS